jgi:hypothetical protein
MKILPVKLTQILALAGLVLALGSRPTPCFAGGHTYGTTQGTMTATTPDTNLVSWPNESKPHHQIRADQTYTAQSDVQVTNGKFNPHGQAVEIRRFFQTRTPGTYSLGPMLELYASTKNRPANSPFTSSHQITDYGPWEPDQAALLSNSASANDVYGVETIELIFVDNSVTPSTQTVLDYEKIDIYGPKASNAANFYVQNFQSRVALNTDTTKAYLGDPPRVTLTANPIYPSAKVWVVIYPGNAQSTIPANARTISNTVWTAPAGDNSTYPNNIYMDIGNYVTGSGIYTLQMVQQSATNSFGTENFGNPASFSIRTNYNITSQLGLVK